MVHLDMPPTTYRTKDFAAILDASGWRIIGARSHEAHATLSQAMAPRYGMEDAATQWLLHEPAQGLHRQFWSHEHKRYEAADDDEAYALLVHLQKTFSNKGLN